MKNLLFTLIILLAAGLTSSRAQNTWTQKADFVGTARHHAVGFSIGNKGYFGTGQNSTNFFNDFWEYDPVNDSWTQRADFAGGYRAGAIGFSIGNKGYVGTGFAGTLSSSTFGDFWEYDPATNAWTQKAHPPTIVRSLAVGFSIGNKGYVGTGHWYFCILSSCGSAPFGDFWEYDPATDAWTKKADFGGTARSSAVGFSIGTKGYIGTGYDGTNFTKDFWEYDPGFDTWTQKLDFGGTARADAVGFNVVNKGYIGTGSAIDGLKKDFWEYDPTTNNWSQKADITATARSGARGFSIGIKGYLGTGYDANGPQKDFWEYTPLCTSFSSPEICNGIDDDCDGLVDLADPNAVSTLWYIDNDQDSYGTLAQAVLSFCKPPNFAGNKDDCNDTSATINPATPEVCNGLDDNCNGLIDIFDPALVLSTASTWYYDGDNDGFGTSLFSVIACTQPTGYQAIPGDCNDDNSTIHPNATEACNVIDDNCNGIIDEGFDADNDGYTTCSGDCNDLNASIHPGASDICNNIDDDCDGIFEENAVFVTYYTDADHDGYGKGSGASFCNNPGTGYSTNNTDCNDANVSIYPNAAEAENGVDDDCDGLIDEDFCLIASGRFTSDITSSSAKLNWNNVLKANHYKIQYSEAGTDNNWKNVVVYPGSATSTYIYNLKQATNYKWKIKSICSTNDKTEFSNLVKFVTLATKEEDELIQTEKNPASLQLYPNPTADYFTIDLKLNAAADETANLYVFNALGQIVYSSREITNYGELKKQITMPSSTSSGWYIVRVVISDQVIEKKLLYQQ